MSVPAAHNATHATLSDETWQQLEDRLAGTPAGPRVRRSTVRRIIVIGVAVVAAATAGWLGAVWLPGLDLPQSGADLPGWTFFAILPLMIAGPVCWVTAIVRGGGNLQSAISDPTLGLARADRRRIERMARGRQPADLQHRTALVALAGRRINRSTSTFWLALGWTPFAFAQFLLNWGTWFGLLYALLAVFFLAMLLWTVRKRRQWRAFLQETEPRAGAEPTPAS
ncbi:hypothetical protein [Curtobacterium sp. VKM Ac-1393]|uniref:hypothetical protein n=1 Tax=Curtobacterium sp. VKM Ac-1393 TaxID=2783814 RepID=UPI00188C81DA|nr:hypothetical protein [Curtobacterium sp. VKM Ac-1393]MBF4605953.1 hypothetical protein [Curtobacterium sp. VKM Ac-1393]